MPNELKNDGIGALASPQMNIDGLSRIVGAVGDIDGIMGDNFDPKKFFHGAKLFGGLSLKIFSLGRRLFP